MARMKVVDLCQRTPEWHDWRSCGITASELPVILGLSPWKTPWRLWAERTGLALPEDLSQNRFVQHGNRYEGLIRGAIEDDVGSEPWSQDQDEPAELGPAVVRAAFEATHGPLLPLCVESVAQPLLRASLDGYGDCPVEIKAPCRSVFERIKADPEGQPSFQVYRAQVQAQCLATGNSHGLLVFGLVERGRLVDRLQHEIVLDEATAQRMLEEVPRFWQLIQDRRAPPLDPLRDLYRPQGGQARQWEHLTRALRHRHAFLQFLKTQIAEHEAACAQLERELLMLMGEFQQGEHDGLAVAVSLKRGSVDYRAVCEAKLSLTAAELDDYRRASQRQVTVTDRDTLKPRAKPRRSVEAAPDLYL